MSPGNTTDRAVLESSLRWYEENAEGYAERARGLGMEYSLSRFLGLLKRPSPLVLDAGCGEGRDVRFMLSRGVDAYGIDASRELIEFAREASVGEPERFQHGRFEEIDEVDRYDGIWCCAALVHHDLAQLQQALCAFRTALRPCGLLWISTKAGVGAEWIGGRCFFYHDPDAITPLLAPSGLKLVNSWIEGGQSTARSQQAWTTIVARSV